MVKTIRPQGQSVENVIHWIKAAIRDGHFSPGQRLIASELSASMGVSLGVVREALSSLDGAGLLELQPNRGALVRPIDPQVLREIYEVRQALEGQAAALAARHIDSSGRKALKQAHRSAVQAASAGEVGSYREANHRLHQLVLSLANNVRLAELASQIAIPIHQKQLALLLDQASMRRSSDEHGRIVEAILAGNELAARSEMALHIYNSGNSLLALPNLSSAPGLAGLR